MRFDHRKGGRDACICRIYKCSAVGDRLMSRGPQSFTQSDLTKALRAAVKAGLEVSRYEIDRDGKIVVITGKLDLSEDPISARDANEWDSVK